MFMYAAKEAVKQNQNQTINNIIYIMYGALIAFFLYKIYKTHTANQKLEGEIHTFKKEFTRMMMGLMFSIGMFAIYNIYLGQTIPGILMLTLIIVIFIDNIMPNHIGENGLVADGKFITWKELQKWAFNFEKGEMAVRYKKGFEEREAFLKLTKHSIKDVNDLIRKYKLNK